MTYHNTSNLRLEVETPPTGLVNLVDNPSGELGAWGWITPIANTLITAYAPLAQLTFRTNVTQAAYFTTNFMAVTPGNYMAARFDIVSISNGHNVKLRYEWYDASGTLLSSSTQSSAVSALGTNYNAAIVVPTGAVRAKLRFDFYNGTGNPLANNQIQFKNVMVTTNTTNTFSTVRKNLITNPSFETNTTGWIGQSGTTLARSTAQHFIGTASLSMKRATTSGDLVARTTVTVTGGRDYTLGVQVKASASGKLFGLLINWFDANGAALSGGVFTQYRPFDGTSWTSYGLNGTAPMSAVSAIVYYMVPSAPTADTYYLDQVLFEDAGTSGPYFDGSFASSGTLTYAWTGTANNSTSTQTNTAFAFADPSTWQNILGPTHTIDITRAALDVGTLSAEILDAMLDPSVADTIKPGKRVRLVADIDGTWQPVYTGKLTNAYVTYPRDKKAGSQVKTRIQVTTSDNITALANQGETRGVEYMADLPLILEGRGVPWNVNGSGNQVNSAVIVSNNDNASVLDQIAVTRDTNHGYAWVDRTNVLNAWDAALLPTDVGAAFSDISGISYTDIDVDFNTETCINSVNINWLRYDIGTDATEEINYGPYIDQASIDKWGAHSATFTIQGAMESASAIADFAQHVLDANATPEVRANNLTMPVRNADEFATAASLDLYDLASVVYADKVNDTYRITAITHTITPDAWSVAYTFETNDSVAVPTWTPSPPFTGTTQETALFNNIHIKSTADANTSAGNTPALKVGDDAAAHLRIDNNEILAMTDDDTQGTLNINLGGGTNIGAGMAIYGIKGDATSVSFNSSGVGTMAHGLGRTPKVVIATSASSAVLIVATSWNSTTVTLNAQFAGGAAWSASNRVVNWLAIA